MPSQEMIYERTFDHRSIIVAFVGIRYLAKFKNPSNYFLSLSVEFKF